MLSEETKTKNHFAKNRLKEIHQLIKDIQEKYSIHINFKYDHSELNPADLVTRGLTFEKFQQKFHYWISGPEWINKSPVIWPSSDLNCLSLKQKSIVYSTVVHCTVECRTIAPIVPFERYLSLSKLLNVTYSVLQAINIFRKNKIKESIETKRDARIHLLTVMQQRCFSDELSYLKNPQGKVPNLVRDLNLLIDKEGLIRSSRRIGKNSTYEYEVINPILIAKDHDLTLLIINDCHFRSKHLGIQTALNKVRLFGFWITKARQAVKKVISQCLICQKFDNLSFKYPKSIPKSLISLNTV